MADRPRRSRGPISGRALFDRDGAVTLTGHDATADALATTDPSLRDFLTGGDVDLYGAWVGLRGLPTTPRPAPTARRPLYRDPATDHVRAMLDRFGNAVPGLGPSLPRFPLPEGDILVLVNYRCRHGRDGHTGDGQVRILAPRTTDAR